MSANSTSSGGALKGRKIIVIGAGSGIGKATAKLFFKEGARMAVLDRDGDALATLKEEIDVLNYTVDITDTAGLGSAIIDAAKKLNGLDGLVITVGIGVQAALAELSSEDWQRAMAVNLTGSFEACKAAVPYLKEAEAATIVTVASASGLMPLGFGLSAYAASKGGLITFTKAIAHELAPRIRANTVCPGPVDTPLLPDAIRGASSLPQSSYALGRIAQAEEIAQGILFLTSDASSYITGTAMAIDGGRTFH